MYNLQKNPYFTYVIILLSYVCVLVILFLKRYMFTQVKSKSNVEEILQDINLTINTISHNMYYIFIKYLVIVNFFRGRYKKLEYIWYFKHWDKTTYLQPETPILHMLATIYSSCVLVFVFKGRIRWKKTTT